MGILDIFRRKRETPQAATTFLSDPADWLVEWADGGHPQTFGPKINEQTAMGVAVVYRCVTLLAGLLAVLPLGVYKDDPVLGRVASPDHRLHDLLCLEPFPGRAMTSFQLKELWGIGRFVSGNAYSIIRYDGAARVVGLEYVDWRNVEVLRQGQRNVYKVNWADGRPVEMVSFENMIHIAGPSHDGIVGDSPIRAYARNAIALFATLQQQMGRIHENSARPSGILEVPGGISPAGAKRMKESFESRAVGRENAGKPFFADNGTKWTPLQIPPEDLNTIAAMQFSLQDVCRIFGVPSHLVNDSSNSTSWGSGLAEQTQAFLRYSLDSELRRIENVLNARLLSGSDYYIMFDREALMQMDPKTMSEMFATQMSVGALTPNELRKKLHRPVIEGGDEPLVNGSMIPLSRALNPPQPPAPAPDQPPPQEDSNES